jgi:hypothetical protein
VGQRPAFRGCQGAGISDTGPSASNLEPARLGGRRPACPFRTAAGPAGPNAPSDSPRDEGRRLGTAKSPIQARPEWRKLQEALVLTVSPVAKGEGTLGLALRE